MSVIVELSNQSSQVKIEQGELIRFISDGVEYIHQKGNPYF